VRGSIRIPNEDAFLCRFVHLLSSLFRHLCIGYTIPYWKMLIDKFPSMLELVRGQTCLNRACRKPIADIYHCHRRLSPVLLRGTDRM